jgi:hypothetical protein
LKTIFASASPAPAACWARWSSRALFAVTSVRGFPAQTASSCARADPAENGVRYTTEEEIVEIDLDGKPSPACRRALRTPSEVYIHYGNLARAARR